MPREEVVKQRAAHYDGEKMEGPNVSVIELHGSGAGGYAERLRRGSKVPLDRLEISFKGKGGSVSELWMSTEYGTLSREVVLELTSSLESFYGPPTHVFELRMGEEFGMQWVTEQGRARLWFNNIAGAKPVAQLQIEDPAEMMSDTALNKDVILQKKAPPADLATFLAPLLEQMFSSEGA